MWVLQKEPWAAFGLFPTPRTPPCLFTFFIWLPRKKPKAKATTKVSKGCSTCALKLQVQPATRARGGDSHLRFMGAKPRFMAVHPLTPPLTLLVALLGALAKRNTRPPHALWPLRFVYPKQLPPKLFSTSLPALPLLPLPLPFACSSWRALPVRQFVSWPPIEWAVPPSCGWHFDSAAATRATPSKLAEIEAEQLELGYHREIYTVNAVKYTVYSMYHKSVYILLVCWARAA